MYLKRLCFREIYLPLSGLWHDRIPEVSGIVASLNAFAYDVINFLYVQDLVLVSKRMRIKMRNFNKCKENLIRSLSTNVFHHAWQHFGCQNFNLLPLSSLVTAHSMNPLD